MKFGLAVLAIITGILVPQFQSQRDRSNRPPTVKIKAADAPFPWSDSMPACQLSFSQASYSCSNGTCTLSCSYTAPNQAYTLLEYKVPPGACSYTSEGTAFSCSSLPDVAPSSQTYRLVLATRSGVQWLRRPLLLIAAIPQPAQNPCRSAANAGVRLNRA